MPSGIGGGFNPLAPRRSAAQQVLALQGNPIRPVMQPDNVPQAGPLFGRPGMTYTQVLDTPNAGPAPKLSYGSGQTGSPSNRQRGHIVGGYVSENDYRPDSYDYQPEQSDTFTKKLPGSVGLGANGRTLVGTYDPHDFTPANYFRESYRAAQNWQEMAFGPSWRALLQWQLAKKYNLFNAISQSRPLQTSDYFAGYQMTIADANGYSGGGMNTLGYR